LKRVDIYDPVTDTWDTTSAPQLQDERANATAIVYDNRIFIIGGRDESDVYKSVETWDGVQNEWQEVHDLREERDGPTSAIFQGKLYVFGGSKKNGNLQEKIEWYDLINDEWREDTTVVMSPPRASAFTFTHNDSVFILGGFYFGPLNSSKILAPDRQWYDGPVLSEGRGEGGALFIDNKAYIIGGETTTGVSATVDIYNTVSGQVESGPALPSARAGFAFAQFNNTVYVFGGHETAQNSIISRVDALPIVTSILPETNGGIPKRLVLHSNFPNPFNGGTRIRYSLAKNTAVEMAVYNVLGEKMRDLLDSKIAAGEHEVIWNGKDNAGRGVAGGTYILMLRSAESVETRKIIYLK